MLGHAEPAYNKGSESVKLSKLLTMSKNGLLSEATKDITQVLLFVIATATLAKAGSVSCLFSLRCIHYQSFLEN